MAGPLIFLFIFQLALTSVTASSGGLANLLDEDIPTLKAAVRQSALLARDRSFHVSQSVDLTYTDVESDGANSVFYSNIRIDSDKPLLVLENVEDHIVDITCQPNFIELKFPSEKLRDSAKSTCRELIGSYVITSHIGCNDEGERNAYRVEAIDVDNEEQQSLFLTVAYVSWRQAFSGYQVSFGHATEQHVFRRHELPTQVEKRATSTTLAPTSNAATQTAVTIDLSSQSTNPNFYDFQGFTLGCNLCKTTGSVTLSQGAINIAGPNGIDLDNPFSVVKSGFVALKLSNFTAHFNLSLTPALVGEIEIPLYFAKTAAFRVPGFGRAGISAGPFLVLDWSLNGGINLSYGLDIKVPDGSTINISLANPNRSSITGFGSTSVTTLPFQANISGIEMKLGLSLRPKFEIGLNFTGAEVEGSAYANVPQAAVEIKQLRSAEANARCEPTDGRVDTKLSQSFSNLTHIVPSLIVDAGLELTAGVDVIDAAANLSLPLGSASPLSIPTACIVFQKGVNGGIGSFASATAVAAALETPTVRPLVTSAQQGQAVTSHPRGNILATATFCFVLISLLYLGYP